MKTRLKLAEGSTWPARVRFCDVTCETCRRQRRFWIKAPSPKQVHADLALAEQLQQAGWREIDGDDYCPECSHEIGLWEA